MVESPPPPGAPDLHLDWPILRTAFVDAVRQGFGSWIRPDQPHFAAQLDFATGRVDEGRGLLHYFSLQSSDPTRRVDLLDIGAGNGGIALAMANCLRYRVFALDIVPNRLLARLQRALGLAVRPVVGRSAALPYRDESFDVVLLVDVLEHVKETRALGAEIMRVLRKGGTCFVSTPARLRYITKPDPHYGVRGLVALPNGLQRFVVNRLLRRRIVTADGRACPAYDVEYTFWHVNEIARLFPGRESAEGLYASEMVPGRLFSRKWLRRRLRGFLYHHVVIRKKS